MDAETGCANLPRVLGAVVRRLDAEQDVESLLTEIVRAAVETIPGADYAALSRIEDDRITAQTSTHPQAARCEQAQSEAGKGPGPWAEHGRDVVTVADTTTDDRWPAFGAVAAEQGVRSVLSLPLFAEHETFGVLTLYAAEPYCFGRHARFVGELFAAQAAVVLSGKRRYAQLAKALTSREVIGQAKGLLMARERVTGQEAFRLLVATSQDANVKVAEIARWMVDDHEHPGQADLPKRN